MTRFFLKTPEGEVTAYVPDGVVKTEGDRSLSNLNDNPGGVDRGLTAPPGKFEGERAPQKPGHDGGSY